MGLRDPKYGLFSEEYLAELIESERKRTERSQNPFMLMLIDMKKALTGERNTQIIRGVKTALVSATRSIDVKGWHRFEVVIGIVLTEIELDSEKTVEEKVRAQLCKTLDRDVVDQIQISTHVFPNRVNSTGKSQRADLVLYPDLNKSNRAKRGYLMSKRGLDVVGSLVALVMFFPLCLLISALIKLTSSGSVFFRQERVGLYGERFKFIKFRTMYTGNDSRVHEEYIAGLIGNQNNSIANGAGRPSKQIYKLTKDTRVTAIGKILRKTSLDELPQFLNVLKGEMSLVGPRPPIPYELELYDLWQRRRVFEAKPGISGLWQVMGRSRTTFDEMVRLDIRYIRNQSLWLDLKILLLTPWVVITGKGAY